MEIIGFTHEIVSPRDAASGLPTGKRQHKPLNITKPIDKATPLIANSLIKLDVFQSATLRSYRTQNGREELFRTIVLMSPWVNARATEDDTHGEVVRHETREHVAFCYQKITWTWHDGGVTAEDDWEAPRG